MKPGARLGPYEIVAALGAGGMGEVYRARDTRLGREVAVKVLPAAVAADPGSLARFEREAKATAALKHSCILSVYDVGTHEGVPYLVEELLEGESLKDRLARGPFAVSEALRIGIEIARGLAAAHEKGIVHRDLKPGNVFLSRDGTVKILDFGLAKLVPPSSGAESPAAATTVAGSTELGTVLGTVAYMAPEQARGQTIDQRVDIFAFGVVLYEMLAGKRPFEGATTTDTLAAILKDAPPSLPEEVPPQVVAVVRRCLDKEPGHRYQRGAELRAALEAAQIGSEPAPGRRSPVARRRDGWLAGAAALVAAVAILWVFDVGGVRSRLSEPAQAPARAVKLAVLPFANLSGDPEQEYLSDGLTQELIAQLGRLHPESLAVIARTSVMRYKETKTPIDQIGRELRVDYVLEGSARRETNRVRVTADLIGVRDQTQIWGNTFERELSGILVMQSEVARQVAAALALELLPGEQARLANVRAVHPEAYEAYLKGNQARIAMTRGSLETAERYFALAARRDPNYAAAWAGIARVWAARNQMGFTPPGEAIREAKAATLKALQLDANDPEAHRALAVILTWGEWDWAAAEREWKRSLEVDSSDAENLSNYSLFLVIMGRRAEALETSERALELDPFNVKIQSFHAVVLLSARRYDDAVTTARTTLRVQPDARVARMALYLALFCKGLYDEAYASDREEFSGDRELREALERGYAEAGYIGARRRFVEVRAARFGTPSGVRAWGMAQDYLRAGDREHAIEWLERAFDEHEPNLPYVVLPSWDSMRSDPRFQDLLRRMKLPLG
ncbi:MAG: protein kinase [Thermoanaerobaculia bacterium]|nr:MAG: protein kinase [Thermoanaerobaculia bacterium]